MTLSAHDSFNGPERFTIRRQLGAGGMGVVYEAFDRERNQRVALKTVQRVDGLMLYRFKNEFRSLSDLVHPNLVRLYELFSDGDLWFFTMELVEGVNFLEFVCPPQALPEDDPLGSSGSIDANALTVSGYPTDPAQVAILPAAHEVPRDDSLDWLQATDAGSTSMTATEPDSTPDWRTNHDPDDLDPTTQAPHSGEPTEPEEPPRITINRPCPSRSRPHLVRLRAALRQMAEVLGELHAQGRLHRDIKPSNVLVTRRGRVVLLDFGLATVLKTQNDPKTTGGHIVGTVSYMAPEQAAGVPLTPASDWYAVGAMLYRALTGRLPFHGKPLDVLMAKQGTEPPPPSTLAPDVPEDLDALCVDLLRRNPEDRPSGEEILRRLGAAPIDTVRPGPQQGRLFVGRESQLAALGEAFEEVRRGRTLIMFVHGRSGAGKSALLQRFLDGLNERGDAVVLAGRCYEQESVAYKALDTLIDALSRYLRRLSRPEAEALLPRDVQALARVFPVLRRVEAVSEAPRRPHEVPDQQELRRRAFDALRELLARIGDRKPLVLTIDDLQWGDLDSATLLSSLLRPPDPPVLLLICSYRSEYATVSPNLRMLLAPTDTGLTHEDRRELAVEPLTPREGTELALALIGVDDPTAQILATMVAREAGGNPYFVYELVQYLKEGGEINESLAISGDISLDEVLWRRIQRLPAQACDLLEILAVAGQPIRQATACRAAGLGAEGFSDLAVLRSNHLIRGTGVGSLDDVETYHDRIRETVLRHLPASRRQTWHRNLSRELEASGNADPETLAVHFEAANDANKAGHYFGLAADRAADALAFDRAAKLYRHALELRPAGDDEGRRLRTRLGDALANAGRGVDAARAYQEAAIGAAQGELLELQRRAGYQFLVCGHIDAGLDAFRDILDRVGMRLPRTPRRALLRLLTSRARLRLRGLGFLERNAERVAAADLELIDVSRSVAVGISVVDVIRGSDYQTRNLLLALRAGEPYRIALALGWEAVHSACQGRPSHRRTAQLSASADALAQRIGHPHAVGMATLSSGAAGYLEGRFLNGLDLLNRAETILHEQCTGVIWELDTARIFGLWALFYLGRIAELRNRGRRVFREARSRGDRYLEATLGPYVGSMIRLADDDVEGSRVVARDTLGQWSQQGFHIQHLCYYYGSLYTDLYAGDAAGAWARTLATAPELKGSLLLRIQHVRVDVAQHTGRCAVAAAVASNNQGALLRRAEVSARRLDRERVPWASAMAGLIRAGSASVRGDLDRAARLLKEAVLRADASDVGLFAAAGRRHLGRLLGGDEGRALIEQADSWMTHQSIRDPARMAAAMVPGFPER